MRKICLAIFIILFAVTGCKKEDGPIYSGTITITDESFEGVTWYNYGLSVPTGKKVSTLNDPLDVITIMASGSLTVGKLFFSTRNLNNSFSKFGEYNNESSANDAFMNLKSFTANSWTETGDSVKPNQIWLYRTHDETYAKIRVISTFAEIRDGMPYPYAECTFEWVYQPDGSSTFPMK
jgi:hypothetical protein